MDARIEELSNEAKSEEQDIDLKIPYRTAFTKAAGMLKSPITIWNAVDPVEKQRLFFFLFHERLSYSKTEAFRTGDSLSSIRIFEEFSEENSDDVDRTGLEPVTFPPFSVDLRGVEPRPRPCHGRILPLNYRPVSKRAGRSLIPDELTARMPREYIKLPRPISTTHRRVI